MFKIGDRVQFKTGVYMKQDFVVYSESIYDPIFGTDLLDVQQVSYPNNIIQYVDICNLIKLNKEENKMKFKVGDKVTVARAVAKQNGWTNSWVSPMTEMLGKDATITKVSEEYGCELDGLYSYPSNALELVATSETTSNDNLSTEFNIDRGVKYQYFTFNDLTLTIGTQIFKNKKGDAKVKWAVTFKNPKDHFSKTVARETLFNREWKTLFVEEGYTRDNIVLKILSDLVYNLENVSYSYKQYIVGLMSLYSYDVYAAGIYK